MAAPIALASDQPVIYDSVTLQHFSAIDRLDILHEIHGHRPTPRWCDEVFKEVVAGASLLESHDWCDRIVKTAWLGNPAAPQDLLKVMKFRAALGSAEKNLGEAESMVLAIETQGIFVTDDRGAFDFAARNPDLGPGRVMDSCMLMRIAEGQGYLTEDDVRDLHVLIRDVPRSMRCRCDYR